MNFFPLVRVEMKKPGIVHVSAVSCSTKHNDLIVDQVGHKCGVGATFWNFQVVVHEGAWTGAKTTASFTRIYIATLDEREAFGRHVKGPKIVIVPEESIIMATEKK